MSVVESYSKAFYQTLNADNKEDQIELLVNVGKAFEAENIKRYFDNPSVSLENKQLLITKLAPKLELKSEGHFLNFLRVLVDKRRVNLLPQIVRKVYQLLDNEKSLKRGKVTSSQELTESEKQEIINKISEKLNSELSLEFYVSKDYIGGLRVEVDGVIFDDTLKSHFLQMESILKNTNLHLNKSL